MKSSSYLLTAIALLLVQRAASANESTWLHRGFLFDVCVTSTTMGRTCTAIDHTWAESNGNDFGHSNDMIQNFDASDDYCVMYNGGTSGCASHRRPVSQQWQYSDSLANLNSVITIGNSYTHESPGAWGINGVCHQATNRALYHTSAYWVENLPVGGNAFSHGVFGYCGASAPWGSQYSCP